MLIFLFTIYFFLFTVCQKVKSLSRVRLFATPWTVTYQASLSMGFPRHEYWRGLPFPSPGDLPHPGTEPGSPTSQADALPSEPPEKFTVCQRDLSNCVTPTLEVSIGIIVSHFLWESCTSEPTVQEALASRITPGSVLIWVWNIFVFQTVLGISY